MIESNRSITVANDDTLAALIRSATTRVVAMAPAFSKAIAEAIEERWSALGADAVTVIVDVDPEVYRLGFGALPALEQLESAAANAGTTLNRHNGIRIGLVIADDTTVVYSPTPQLIEAGPRRPETPNAIVLGSPPPEVSRDLGDGPEGTREQVVGLDKAERSKIEEVKRDLARNPPQQFDIARTVRVFNAYFEFVDFELRGLQVQRRTAPIPSDLMGLAKDESTQRKLQASFRLIDETHDLSGKEFQDRKKLLVQNYLTSLPGFGNVILRTKKEKFEEEVEALRRDVDAFKSKVQADLQTAMDSSRNSLTTALLPAVKAMPPKRWHKHFEGQLDDALASRLLGVDLHKAFRSAEELVKEMKVKVVFKGVTYELLCDEHFTEIARDRLPALAELHDEYDAAEGTHIPEG